MRRAARTDENQSEIVYALRKIGATVLITSNIKNAFDVLVGYRGKLYIVEIKDGSKPPSQKRLTEGELKCKESFERVGVSYNVVESVEEAIELVTRKDNDY